MKNWCKNGITQWADINGDGKADMICDYKDGQHWAQTKFRGKTTRVYKNFCKNPSGKYLDNV